MDFFNVSEKNFQEGVMSLSVTYYSYGPIILKSFHEKIDNLLTSLLSTYSKCGNVPGNVPFA